MLESAELGHVVSKRDFDRAEPTLREALVNAQYDLLQGRHKAVVVLLSGVVAGGRGETAKQLAEWMDPRHLRVHAFGARTPEELAHPLPWRYWKALPPRGQIAVYMNAWYAEALQARLSRQIDAAGLDAMLHAIREYERMLAHENVLLLKFWIHLSKQAQKQRLAELDRKKTTSWRVTDGDWNRARQYSKSHALWEHTLRESSTGEAPWYVVEGSDARYRDLTVGGILLDSLTRANQAPTTAERQGEGAEKPAAAAPAVIDNVKLIRDLDLTQKIDGARFERELERLQGRLARLTQHKRFRRHSLVLVFEGTDAAGKGGAIRRVTGALDPRQYEVVPVASPTDEELAHPYLWRFWRQVPRQGGITIFDRSWYGRVLVERVEGYCSEYDWLRAYGEINGFEKDLIQAGAVVCKFWLQISEAEQLARFRAREKISFKRFKITEDDWRNRKRWPDYEQAVADMVDRTSTELAPWTLVEAEDKRFARIKILRSIVDRLGAALDDKL
jgi:AMP-polyphosphate phosphotransferase